MSRQERLHALAQDINKLWTYKHDANGILASCMNDDSKLRLSGEEFNAFVFRYAERLLDILRSPDKVEWGTSETFDAVIEQIEGRTTVLDSTMSVIPAEIMTAIEADWNVKKFAAPQPSAPQFICFSTPLRLPHRQAVELSKHSKAIALYISESSEVLTLCRGILRFDTHIHLIYTFHPVGSTTRVAVVSDYTNGAWKTSTGALIVKFLDWLAGNETVEQSKKGEHSEVSISLYQMERFEMLCGYAEHLAEMQPQCDAAIQAWLRSKEFDTEKPFKPVDRHSAAVNLYLEVTRMLVEISQKPGLDDFYRQAAARIRLATIYEIDASLFRQLIVRSKPLIDKLTENYSGTPEQRLYRAAQSASPIPEHRPFTDMFIALSRPVRLDQYQDVTSRLFEQIRNRPTGTVWCEAIFITRDFPLLVFQAEPPHRELLSLWTDHWEAGDTLLPWALPWLVRLLYEHEERVIAQQTGRVSYQTKAKKLRVPAKTPPPYYAVSLRAHHLSQARGPSVPRNTDVEWRHRWHVQAHERAYVQRGTLPLELNERERLLQHGYQVFEDSIDNRCRKALERRGKHLKRYDEWLAIKYVTVDESIKPDRPDLPLVPSTRRIKTSKIT